MGVLGVAAAGKASGDSVYMQVIDTLDAELYSPTANTVHVTLIGEILASANASGDLVVDVYEGDTANVIWTSRIGIGRSATKADVPPLDSIIVIGWDAGQIDVTLQGDTAVLLTIDAISETITHADTAEIGIYMSFNPAVTNDLYYMPTLTPYGVALLVVLLGATGVWLYRRRRLVRT